MSKHDSHRGWKFAVGDRVRHAISLPESVTGIVFAREMYQDARGTLDYYHVQFIGHDGRPCNESYRATSDELRKVET